MTRTMTSAEADVIEAAMELETLMIGAHYGPMPLATIKAAEKALSKACADLASEGDGEWHRPKDV